MTTTSDEGATDWLRRYLETHGGAAGTVHVRKGDLLILAAAVNIPPKVQDVTAQIPLGKGMAGLSWQRNAPVTTCNLQKPSPDVKPGAAAVNAQAAAALPVRDERGEVRAIVGIAFSGERELGDEQLSRLTHDAQLLPR